MRGVSPDGCFGFAKARDRLLQDHFMVIAGQMPPSDVQKHEDVAMFSELVFSSTCGSGERSSERAPRVALLTPYNGGNLGDAAIQDAVILNLRLRLPRAQFSGITLNCDSFLERHGVGAFPLDRGTPLPHAEGGRTHGRTGKEGSIDGKPSRKNKHASQIRRTLKSMPELECSLKAIHSWITAPWREFRHWLRGYWFLRTQNLLIVSGGGQLDEEWGGPWAHPYALFKWAVLARIAQVPYAIASVGVCKVSSMNSRLLLSVALRLAQYRSFRDQHSKKIAAGILQRCSTDPVIPDLAFNLSLSATSRYPSQRTVVTTRPVIAVSLIAYAKPRNWPYQNHRLYIRYLREMAQVVSELIKRGNCLVIVYSSLGDDQSVISDFLEQLDDQSREAISREIQFPEIQAWQDFVAAVKGADFLIASRLHSTILGFVTQTPTIAISFDPKVDWVMEDLGMTDYLLQIRDFVAEDVVRALDRIAGRREAVVNEIASYQSAITSTSEKQYDALAALAVGKPRR